MRRIDTEPLIITGGFASLIERARANGDFDVPQSRLVGVKTHVPDESSLSALECWDSTRPTLKA